MPPAQATYDVTGPTAVSPETVGERIRELRIIRDWSLRELGARSHVSTAYLSYVERGERAPTPQIVGAVAGALGVGVSVLYGQPYIKMLQADRLDALLTPIAGALDAWDIPVDDLRPPTLTQVAERTKQLAAARSAGDFGAAAEQLPDLIASTALAMQAASEGTESERAYALLADQARTAAITAYRLGYMNLARLALSRMQLAAPQSGDPRQIAVERYERAVMTHAETARPDRGVALVRRALTDLGDDDEPATYAVRGTLLLRASALSAAQGKHDDAADWLHQADELARAGAARDAAELGPNAGDRYSLAFGHLNVGLGRLDLAMARDDHEGAVQVAGEIRIPDGYQPTRRAGFLIRRASAEAWTARHAESLQSLEAAKAAAPQLTRYHPEVHETVGLLLRARQRAIDPLREFARWSGI